MVTLKHKFLRAGFSMTEVMVGGAILAGIALAGARMFKDQRQAQTKVDAEQELLAFHQMLTRIMQNENTCNATMKNGDGTPPGAWNLNPTQVASFDIDNIYDCTTCTSTSTDYDALSVAATPTGYGEDQWIKPNTWMWKITDISWKSTPDGTGPAVLKITYGQAPAGHTPGDWTNSRARKVFTISKDINLTLRFTQDNNPANRLFKECVAGKQSAINNLQNDICGSMTQITSTGNVMVWSDATQGCVALGNTSAPVKVCTSANLVIDGINSDGTVRCRSLTYGVVPASDLMYPIALPGAGCAPGATVRMEYDTVQKKLKAKCD